MRISKESWRKILSAIRFYPENCRLLTEWEMEVLDADLKERDPTAHKAMLLQSEYAKRLKREIDAVEELLDILTEEERNVIRVRYWSGKSIVPYEYMAKCHYSVRQMKRIINKAVKIVGVGIGELNPKRWHI